MDHQDTEKKTLTNNEMEQVNGGFEYDGILEWLKGYNIVCPTCGNEDEGSITKRYATGIHIYFTCKNCGQKFNYTPGANKGTIKMYKED